MWNKLRAIFTIPELRQKIFLTLLLLAVFRVGYQIALPIIDQEAVREIGSNKGLVGSLLDKASVFAASDLKRLTVFGLGIMPYISASIILQLMGTVYKPLEDLRKEGETGRKKINEYTRYLTLLMCIFQGGFYLQAMISGGGGGEGSLTKVDNNFLVDGSLPWIWFITCLVIMTCGTMFVMWLGEQIDEFGIGNGVSLLIMAGIVAQMPAAMQSFLGGDFKWELTGLTDKGVETLLVLVVLFFMVVAGVVFMTLGQRQIPTQSAKHVRGRRVYGGAKQYLPLRLNQSGVMPIIFASSMLLLPSFLFGMLANGLQSYSGVSNFFAKLANAFQSGTSLIYIFSFVALIYFFSYFWMAITFNPKEMAENLKEFGTFIPGHRPGRPTANYLERVMVRITYVGAAFLAVVAIVPTIITSLLKGVDPQIASFYGGTGLLIAVSVAFDLIQKIDSHLVMRDYRGLLED